MCVLFIVAYDPPWLFFRNRRKPGLLSRSWLWLRQKPIQQIQVLKGSWLGFSLCSSGVPLWISALSAHQQWVRVRPLITWVDLGEDGPLQKPTSNSQLSDPYAVRDWFTQFGSQKHNTSNIDLLSAYEFKCITKNILHLNMPTWVRHANHVTERRARCLQITKLLLNHHQLHPGTELFSSLTSRRPPVNWADLKRVIDRIHGTMHWGAVSSRCCSSESGFQAFWFTKLKNT